MHHARSLGVAGVRVGRLNREHLTSPRALADGLPNGELCWLTSPHGHDAFLIEQAIVLRAVREFRARAG